MPAITYVFTERKTPGPHPLGVPSRIVDSSKVQRTGAKEAAFIEVFSDLVFTVIQSLLSRLLRPPCGAAKVVLLTSQGRHRIDRSDAASRNEARPRRSREQQQRYTNESQGIRGFDLE